MKIFTWVIAPLFLSFGIYLCFRKPLPDLILYALPIDLNYDTFKLNAPYWIRNNAPDALWAFSFAAFVMLASTGLTEQVRMAYIILAGTSALATELLQEVWLPGTFDMLDLVAITLGFIFPIYFLYDHEKKQ